MAVLTVLLVLGIIFYIIQLFRNKKVRQRLTREMDELREWHSQEKEKLWRKIQSLHDELASHAKLSERNNDSIKEVSQKCLCVATGGDISTKLTHIVQQNTEESTLEFTQRVYRVLEISEELNRSIQLVVGALSSEKDGGLTQDVVLLEEEQQEIDYLIEDFIEIRSGYSAEVERIKQGMSSIGKFVGVITELADKTNVLAINASIEAARAGRAGDGFAVIGSEIQELSKNTKEIAEQINSTIHTSVAAVSDSVDLYNEKISSTVQRLEKSGKVYSELIRKLKPQIDELAHIVGFSDELSNQVHENVDQITVQLQYQDRVKQILDHLICIQNEIGSMAKETAQKYTCTDSEHEARLYTELLQNASRHFSCDEEFAAFGLEDDIGLLQPGSKEEAWAGNVELF